MGNKKGWRERRGAPAKESIETCGCRWDDRGALIECHEYDHPWRESSEAMAAQADSLPPEDGPKYKLSSEFTEPDGTLTGKGREWLAPQCEAFIRASAIHAAVGAENLDEFFANAKIRLTYVEMRPDGGQRVHLAFATPR